MPTDQDVLNLLAKVAETDDVRSNLNLELFDSGILDSLKTVELMVALGEQFNIRISPAELDRDEWATPLKLIQFVQARLAANAAP